MVIDCHFIQFICGVCSNHNTSHTDCSNSHTQTHTHTHIQSIAVSMCNVIQSQFIWMIMSHKMRIHKRYHIDFARYTLPYTQQHQQQHSNSTPKIPRENHQNKGFRNNSCNEKPKNHMASLERTTLGTTLKRILKKILEIYFSFSCFLFRFVAAVYQCAMHIDNMFDCDCDRTWNNELNAQWTWPKMKNRNGEKREEFY